MQFDIQDVTALPAPQKRTETRAFTASGKEWEVTITADGATDPESMYRLSRILNREQQTKPRSVVLPGVTPFTLTDPFYIRNLEFLRAVSVSPAWNTQDGVDRWAIFGQRLGATVMTEIIAWALQANFLDGSEESEEAKRAAGEAIAQTP